MVQSKKKKKAIGLCSLFFSFFKIHSSSHLTSDKQEVLVVLAAGCCSIDSTASCGRFGPLSEEASFSSNNEPNIDIYFMNPTFRTSCNGSLALLHCFLYQLPDYTAVVHPKEGVDRMWGRRRKSPSSHSHTDGFHMGFWGKAPLNSSTQTTVNSVLLP